MNDLETFVRRYRRDKIALYNKRSRIELKKILHKSQFWNSDANELVSPALSSGNAQNRERNDRKMVFN